MEKIKINNKTYFVEETYDGWATTQNFNETKEYVESKTTFFKTWNSFNSSQSLLTSLALKNALDKYENIVDKLIDEKKYYKLATNIEKYTDLYVLQLGFSDVKICGPRLEAAFEIDKDFNIDKNLGFIAVKKDQYKSKKEAYEFMKDLAKKYREASEISFYNIEVSNENEEYSMIIDEKLYDELGDLEKIAEYVIKECA